jgi:hypothetical protein
MYKHMQHVYIRAIYGMQDRPLPWAEWDRIPKHFYFTAKKKKALQQIVNLGENMRKRGSWRSRATQETWKKHKKMGKLSWWSRNFAYHLRAWSDNKTKWVLWWACRVKTWIGSAVNIYIYIYRCMSISMNIAVLCLIEFAVHVSVSHFFICKIWAKSDSKKALSFSHYIWWLWFDILPRLSPVDTILDAYLRQFGRCASARSSISRKEGLIRKHLLMYVHVVCEYLADIAHLQMTVLISCSRWNFVYLMFCKRKCFQGVWIREYL